MNDKKQRIKMDKNELAIILNEVLARNLEYEKGSGETINTMYSYEKAGSFINITLKLRDNEKRERMNSLHIIDKYLSDNEYDGLCTPIFENCEKPVYAIDGSTYNT